MRIQFKSDEKSIEESLIYNICHWISRLLLGNGTAWKPAFAGRVTHDGPVTKLRKRKLELDRVMGKNFS